MFNLDFYLYATPEQRKRMKELKAECKEDVIQLEKMRTEMKQAVEQQRISITPEEEKEILRRLETVNAILPAIRCLSTLEISELLEKYDNDPQKIAEAIRGLI